MIQQEFSWKTADGLKLLGREWKPNKNIRAAIILIHGLGEHCGRYQHVAEFFTRFGFVISSFDLRGHGVSEGIRGHAPSYDTLSDDIQHCLERVSKDYQGIPCFLYGHSLGGSLVLYFVLTRQPCINGVIVTSPGLVPGKKVSSIKLMLAKIINLFSPSIGMDNGLDINGLSRNPTIVEEYKNDPLVHRKISARLGMELINKGAWILTQADNWQFPMVLIQGSADRLINCEATKQFIDKVKGDVTLKIYEGLFHELHNEPEKEEVFNFILDWLNRHIGV